MKALFSAGLFLCASSLLLAQENHTQSSVSAVTVDIRNAKRQSVGTAVLTPAPRGVKISIDIKNFPPGEYSFHIHQFAKCLPPDFKSAGAHFDGAAHKHGGPSAGDIPDFTFVVAANGTAHASTVAPDVTLGTDDHSVFSKGGTSIVIHAVTGNAGAQPRIACGAITRPE